ncbi:outer envelope pore protein 16, chloroplastic-like [Panicum hallii]|nr:outer envelope pore protein 16, chloroplastic-like [Panicum hallii]
MFKEGAYWGAAAGAFEAIEYGVELMRGRSDWKNAMIGGAIAGALISAANSTHRGNRRVIKDAIAGGAIGTAVDFISHRRHVVFGPIRLDDTDGIDQMWDIPRNANKNGVKMDRSWDFKDASDWICGMWAKGRTSPTQQ